ncbi:MAG: hydroxyethylthiazole kinase [Elusimicrobia bacterium]|nr:hydroxyethylthiazole kinase [Elusimicrobiota bacterium]
MPKTICDLIYRNLKALRKDKPLVHNITNYVAMNFTANGLLALGASPVMAHGLREVKEMASMAGALVLNIGTLSPAWVSAMLMAGKTAKLKKIPVVFDPVGAGATKYRTKTSLEIIRKIKPDVIRGNASEILALANGSGKTKGVDSSAKAGDVLDFAGKLSQKTGSVVVVSGPTDFIFDGKKSAKIKNGHPIMPCITAMGCMASAYAGAFCAVDKNYFSACISAMAVMGICGEIAAQKSKGPGSFVAEFLDAVYNLSEKDIKSRLKV